MALAKKGTLISDIPPLEMEKYLAKQAAKYETVSQTLRGGLFALPKLLLFKVKIRIVFQDRQELEALFGVKEKVKAIEQTIRDCLADDSLSFQLCRCFTSSLPLLRDN